MDHVGQRVQSGRVNRRHSSHAEDEDFWLSRNESQCILERFRRAKKERPVDLVHFDAAGNGWASSKVIAAFVIEQLIGNCTHVGERGHAAHEEKGGEHHANLDGNGEIDEHR